MAHQKLDSMIRTLRDTNWAGAKACIILAGEIDMWVAELYNRAESAFLGVREAPAGDSAAIAEPEIPSSRAEVASQGSAPLELPDDKLQRCVHGLTESQDCGLCKLAQAEDEKEPYS